MGNSKGKTTQVLEKEDFQIDHPRLKDLKFKKTSDEEVMQANFSIYNKADYSNWENKLQRDPGAGSEDVMTPIKQQFKQAKMCGSGGKAHVTYENFPYLLSTEIKNRQKYENRKFQESQIWYLLYTLGNVGSKYHRAGEKVGDLSPNNTFMNQQGSLKLASKYSWPDQKTNYERAFYQKDPSYLAPQQIKQLYLGRNVPETDFEKAESFSAGLTALDAALLQNSSSLYDKKFNFDYDLLNGKRQNLKNDPYYGNLLKLAILNLTQPDARSRMTLTQLKNWLEPYSQDIGNLREFQPQNLPPALNNSLSQTQFNNQNNQNYRSSGTFPEQNNRYSTNPSAERVSAPQLRNSEVPTYSYSTNQRPQSQQYRNSLSFGQRNSQDVFNNVNQSYPESMRTMPPSAVFVEQPNINRGSQPIYQQTRNQQFIMPPNQPGRQFNSEEKRNLNQQFVNSVIPQQQRIPEDSNKKTVFDKIKEAPGNIAYQVKHFRDPKERHINQDKVHSMSPPRYQNQRNNPAIIQRNVQYPPAQFQRGTINEIPRDRYYQAFSPRQQRNFAPIQNRQFHSPPPRPMSNYQPNQMTFNQPQTQFIPPQQIFNERPVSNYNNTRIIPGGYATEYRRETVIPGGRNVQMVNTQFRKVETNNYSNNNYKFEQNAPIYSRQSVNSKPTGGKTSLDLIQEKIKNSRRNFPSELS